jgi:serine phosphatase RsbU (regulator of sigma subunit)
VGEDRFAEAVKASSNLPARQILEQLIRDATFAAGAKQHDDMTLVVI